MDLKLGIWVTLRFLHEVGVYKILKIIVPLLYLDLGHLFCKIK